MLPNPTPIQVNYVMRCPGTGHSLEAVFGEMSRRPLFMANWVVLPHISRGPISILKNLWFLFHHRHQAGIWHITGDVHYAALVLPPSKTVLTIHDCYPLVRHRQNRLRYHFFRLVWYVWPMRRAKAVISISEHTKHQLTRHVGRIAERMKVIPNGVSDAYTYKPKPELSQPPLLLQIGAMPHKNLHRLAEALRGIPCRLVIVGKLDAVTYKSLIINNIFYETRTNLTAAQMLAQYEACDIVTFVSTEEGFGMPILEANAAGRPVLTADRSPMRDVAGQAALLTDPTDVQAIRAAVINLLTSESLRETLTAAGRENAARFSMARMAEQYAEVYRALIR